MIFDRYLVTAFAILGLICVCGVVAGFVMSRRYTRHRNALVRELMEVNGLTGGEAHRELKQRQEANIRRYRFQSVGFFAAGAIGIASLWTLSFGPRGMLLIAFLSVVALLRGFYQLVFARDSGLFTGEAEMPEREKEVIPAKEHEMCNICGTSLSGWRKARGVCGSCENRC